MARFRVKPRGPDTPPAEREVFPRKGHDDYLAGVVYPGPYAVGMSSLGFQWALRRIETTEGFCAERFFAGPPGKGGGTVPRSLEAGRTPVECHFLAVSMAYEPDAVAFLQFLRAAGIPAERCRRDRRHPLVLGGGSAFQVNPVPLSPFVDVIVAGDGEEVLPALLKAYREAPGRAEFLERAARLGGVWVPSLSPARPGAVAAPPVAGDVLAASGPPFSNILSPGAEFADTLLVEISRGCPGGCRFCWAGYRHRPPRSFPADAVLDLARQARPAVSKVGLVATSVCRHPEIGRLLDGLLGLGYGIGVSSLRLADLTPDLLGKLAAGGEDSVTLAPETGSRQLGNALNKPCDPAVIREACARVFAAGIRKLRVYFMVGLPGETREDVEASLDLAESIHRDFTLVQRSWDRPGAFSVNVSPFVPRPHTPFAREAMDDPAALRRKLALFRARLGRLANTEVRLGSVDEARLQWRLGNGDLETARELLALAEGRLPLRRFIEGDHGWLPHGPGSGSAPPWEVLDPGLRPGFLEAEHAKSGQGIVTGPCPGAGHCGPCRACR
ncbi:MAG: radical SAM protein [Acidobacteria bacterium]|nr:radical SAM protein [Acidobacteriota bacterium]